MNMLNPKDQWTWYLDKQTDCLAIQLDEEQCVRTGFSSSMLLKHLSYEQSFNLEHMICYGEAFQALEDSEFVMPDEFKSQVALNTVAAAFFCSMPAAKSWHYKHQADNNQAQPAARTLAWVESQLDSALMMIVHQFDNVATCLTLSRQFQLTESKMLERFSLVSLHQDRLRAIEPSSLSSKRA